MCQLTIDRKFLDTCKLIDAEHEEGGCLPELVAKYVTILMTELRDSQETADMVLAKINYETTDKTTTSNREKKYNNYIKVVERNNEVILRVIQRYTKGSRQ